MPRSSLTYVKNKQYTKRTRVYDSNESTFHCGICHKTMLYVSYYMHIKQVGHIRRLNRLNSDMFPYNNNIHIAI